MLRGNRRLPKRVVLAMMLVSADPAWAQNKPPVPSTAERPLLGESTAAHQEAVPQVPQSEPATPEGMTLEEALNYAESPPPGAFPVAVSDSKLYTFTLFDQLEYRAATDDDTTDGLGWDVQGWIGGDLNKLCWKNEGEAVFGGTDEGEAETDLLYSRLITPFWYVQVGAQYANEWRQNDYKDRWSGVIALQGLAPYRFEVDNSLYISENGDVTFVTEASYDLRITQRLVMRPRASLAFAAQDIPGRDLGAGVTDVNLDVRLRYEIRRECAPYFGIRRRVRVGETREIAKTGGADTEQVLLIAGVRFAF